MQTRDFAAAIQDIVDTFKLQALDHILQPVAGRRGQHISDDEKMAFRRWISHAIQMQPTLLNRISHQLLPHYDLTFLLSDNLIPMIVDFTNSAEWDQVLSGTHGDDFRKLYFGALRVTGTNNDIQKYLIEPKLETIGPDEDTFVFRVRDIENKGVELSRVSDILNILSDLTDTIHSVNPDDDEARIAYTDTGSDLTFAVVMDTATVTLLIFAVKYVYTQWRDWDVNMYNRKARVIEKNADLSAKIHEYAVQKKLDKNKEKLLLRSLDKALPSLMDLGAYPDEQDIQKPEALRLPKSKPKLLSAGEPVEMKDDKPPTVDDGDDSTVDIS